MDTTSPRFRIALLAAALLVAGIATVLLWPRDIDPPAELAELPAPPLVELPPWPDASGSAPELRWALEPNAALSLPDGTTLSPTPAPNARYWSFQEHIIEGWTALIADAGNGDHATWWIAPNAPYAILELHADLSRGDWYLDLPKPPMHLYPTHLRASTDDPDALADASLLGLTLDLEPLPLSLTVDGPVRATIETSAQGQRLHLDALPRDCESLISAPVNLRLIIHVGASPLPTAPPSPAGATAQLIPIFAEPPNRGGDPWEEGRSRTPKELARRIRALIFGHSNPDDPRYGNGGLLQQNIGASFSIPALWWDTAPIIALRDDLEDSPIELILATDEPEQAPTAVSLRTDAPLECATLASRAFVIGSSTADAPHYSLGAWLPRTPEVTRIAPLRATILQKLLPDADTTGALRSGRVSLVEVPLIASRNPLVDIFQQTLLVPERQGHWTLHEDLSRALVGFEFREDRSKLALTSLATRAFSQRPAQAPALWQPDHSLSDSTRALLRPDGIVRHTNDVALHELAGPDPIQWHVER